MSGLDSSCAVALLDHGKEILSITKYLLMLETILPVLLAGQNDTS